MSGLSKSSECSCPGVGNRKQNIETEGMIEQKAPPVYLSLFFPSPEEPGFTGEGGRAQPFLNNTQPQTLPCLVFSEDGNASMCKCPAKSMYYRSGPARTTIKRSREKQSQATPRGSLLRPPRHPILGSRQPLGLPTPIPPWAGASPPGTSPSLTLPAPHPASSKPQETEEKVH